MKGRKAVPIKLHSDGRRLHRSNEELKIRAEGAPQAATAHLKCPTHMCPEAKKEWRKITALYKGLSETIVTDLDKNALEIYCENVVTYRKAMVKLRETSEVYTSRTNPNKPQKNPWLTVANDAATQIKKFGEVLLLDPVSRARVGLAKSTSDENLSPTELYFKNKAAKDHGAQ